MILRIDNITKSYGTNLALNGFSATLDAGIYALLGDDAGCLPRDQYCPG